MTNNSDFEITNGKIKLPYNFNDEKYIIGIERKSDNTLMAGKTIIPIRDSKPSYILEITPKTYPTFYFKKSESEKCYELVKNEVFFNVNFIMDEIPLSTSDYDINVDWNEKYAITKTNLPKEVKLTLSEKYHKINSGDTHYDILEQNNEYSDRINLTLIDNKNLLVYSTVLEIVFQKSYFETISKYDSIDISERNSSTEKKKNVITIDGYYNDNKIDRNDLELKFKTGSDVFTSLVSTMKYANIVKGQNEFYLAHRELSKTKYKETPLHDCIVKNNNIYRKKDGEEILLVSDRTLYNGIDNKIIDTNGNVYSGTTQLIDSSGNITLNNNIKIDNSGNTLYSNNKLIDIENNVIKSNAVVLSDLNKKEIYSSGVTSTYDFEEKCLYSGNTTTLILDNNYYVPCYQSHYNLREKILFIDTKDSILYNNNNKILHVSGNTDSSALTINPQNNIFNIGAENIIAEGKVNGMSGFIYNISNGEISDKSGNTIVTALNSYNAGTATGTTTDSTKTGYTFNSGYTFNNRYYVSNIDGSLNYIGGQPLLSGKTIYTTGGAEVVKYPNVSSGIRMKLIDGTWIKFNYSGNATGYSTSTGSTLIFTATTSSITNTSMTSDSGGTYYIYNDMPSATNWSIKKSGNTITYKLINGLTIEATNPKIPIGNNFFYHRQNYDLLYNTNNTDIIIADLNSILGIQYITLGNDYYYIPSSTSKVIQYNSTSVNSGYPQVNLTYLTFNSGTTFSRETQIISGVVKNNDINILNLQTGVLDLGKNYKYHYKNKILFSGNTQNNNIICDFTSGKITKSGTTNTQIVNLNGNIIVNYKGQTLVDENGYITLVNGYKFNVYNKIITNSGGTLNINFSNSEQLILSGDILSPFKMDYYPTTKKYNISHNNSNIITIDGNDIIFNQPNYRLSATTEYSEESEITRIKDLNITIDNQNYSWDITGDIKCEEYTITNENRNKNFYYCDGNGNICFNNEIVKYVIDKDEKYYNLETGKQVILQDGETFIDTTTLSILPEKNKILDKYNNIKITKGTSYDLINKIEKDNNDKVISGETNSENFTIDDIFYTVVFDINRGEIFDSNNRLISDLSGQTIFIEGGLTVNTDKIYSGETELVSGITSSETIGLTSNESNYNVTLSGDTVYYRDKKAYSVNEGGFYFEKKINELFSTGFTLSNGLEITPISQPQVNSANDGNSVDRPDYTHGFEIKSRTKPDFAVYVTFDNEGGGGGGIHIDYDENDDNNPGFTTDENGDLIYDNLKIISIKDGQLLNPRDPLEMKNGNIWVNYMRYLDGVVLDLGGGKVDTEIQDKNGVYYYAHRIDKIKKNIPDLISYMFKQNKNAFDINIEATYIDVMSDIKNYTLIEGGNNNSSYEIKVEPQFITSNMITNGSTVVATIVNNNGDHIDNNTYTNNNYKFTYLFDGSSEKKEVTEDTLKITLSTGTPIFNEIKFSLECDGKLVKQEIVEVLGENKLITSVEYVDVSNGNATYIIQPTTNAYYGTDIIWKNNNNEIITELTLTSASTKQVIYGYCNGIRVYEQTILPLKKGEQGEPGKDGTDGKDGEPGRRGKLLYPAGKWNSGTIYDGTDDEKTPFVLFDEEYYVLTSDKIISGTTYTPGSSTAWTKMEQYEAIYTKLLVAENGVVGGSVYNGDYVFSKDGINASGETNSNYNGFTNVKSQDTNFESGVALIDLIFKGYQIGSGEPLTDLISENGNFIPNYLVDFSKGRAWFGAGNTIINQNGGIYTNNLVEELNEYKAYNISNGSLDISGKWDEKVTGVSYSIYIQTGETENDVDLITTSAATYYVKNITGLNSYINYIWEENETTCVDSLNYNLYDLNINDESITKPNVFYRGSINIGNGCATNIAISFRQYNYIGLPNEKESLKNIFFTPFSSGNRVLNFLFKWDGTTTANGRKNGYIDILNMDNFNAIFIKKYKGTTFTNIALNGSLQIIP